MCMLLHLKVWNRRTSDGAQDGDRRDSGDVHRKWTRRHSTGTHDSHIRRLHWWTPQTLWRKCGTIGSRYIYVWGIHDTMGSLLLVIWILVNNFQTNKVNNESSFVGCINRVEFDGVPLSLWANILSHESKATCCAKPPSIPSPNIITGANFNGLVAFYYKHTYSMTKDFLSCVIKILIHENESDY